MIPGSLPPRRRWLAIFLATLVPMRGTAQEGSAQSDSWSNFIQPALANHCTKCHGEDGTTKGKVDLLRASSPAHFTNNLELLEEVIDVLDLGEMPPEKEPALPPATRTRLLAELRGLLQSAVAENQSYPPIPLRRLNRFQYNNAVRDLFGLKAAVFTLPERMLRDHSNYFQPHTGTMPPNLRAGSRALGKSQLIEKRLAGVAAFPQDLRAEHGFDNRADLLTLSPLLMESFLALSQSIVESPDFNPKSVGIWNDFFAAPEPGADLPPTVGKRLRPLLRRAFRQPVDKDTLDRYTSYALSEISAGKSFTDSMKGAASALLSSPRFLYLSEEASDGGQSEPANDYELASRLSFFLWGSLPDQRLLDLAGEGKLHDPETLGAEVDRMMNDRRLKRFCDSFPRQWLQLERIISSVPNREKFPSFFFAKYRASMHMMLEPLLLFETILIEDRSIIELIDPEFSYHSSLLESWYRDRTKAKGRQVGAIGFKRVPVKDRRYGGVITNAAVMTMTSSPERTQPITRGAWVASVIFNDPPKPPPADVPPLPELNNAADQSLTLRERFATHRETPACAVCHAQIDPLGFALENYDATGGWRELYENGRPVDASGELFRKHKFEHPAQFKDAILAEKDRFARGFAAHLLSFALGRELSPLDSPALDLILTNTSADDYRLRTLIRQVALSEPFRYKSTP